MMGKRLIRIFQPDLLQRSSELVNREIHVVLKSNQTLFGHCWKIENQIIFIKDLRQHAHNLTFTQIESVIYDQAATF